MLRGMVDRRRRATQKLGITPQQHQALLAIKGLPADKEMTVGMLAD